MSKFLQISFIKVIFHSLFVSVKDEWQIFAEKIDGITNIDIQYYSARKDNPVLEILKDYCNNMKIDTLYRLLVESGANAYADFL